MAPLPMSHRPLSIDSRDNSMSTSSRGAVDSSADSGSGFSLPMRSQRTSSTPDSPSTLNETLGASSDYLVPTTQSNDLANVKQQYQQQGPWRKSQENGLDQQSQSHQNGQELEPMLTGATSQLGSHEVETSFIQKPTSLNTAKKTAPSRISNKAYGLTSSNRPMPSYNITGSASTQPLLSSPESGLFEAPSGGGIPSVSVAASTSQPTDNDGCPLGPLPPTPTDQQPSPVTPVTSAPVALDVSSLGANRYQSGSRDPSSNNEISV